MPGAAVDREPFGGIVASRRAAIAGVGGHRREAGADVSQEEPVRGVDQAPEIRVADVCDQRERVDSARVQHFRFVDVADPRHDALIEEGIADLHLGPLSRPGERGQGIEALTQK